MGRGWELALSCPSCLSARPLIFEFGLFVLKRFGSSFVALSFGGLGSDQARLLVVGESFSNVFFKISFRKFFQGFEAILITLGDECDNFRGSCFHAA